MKIAVMETVVGAVAIDESGNLKYNLVSKDIGYMIERALKIESGELSQEFADLVSKILAPGVVLIVPTELEESFLAQRNISCVVDPRNELVIELRKSLPSIAVKEGLARDEEDFNSLVYEVAMGVT
ncbi:MAG: hypothetical protein NZ925_02840, partial [Sulfolobales archaeon]|nr:hypothetical protein [Sulfolobales archaeon]